MIEVIAKYADIDEPQAFFAREKVEYVVRCRDCEHSGRDGWACYWWSNPDQAEEVEPDGYCAWGTRRQS